MCVIQRLHSTESPYKKRWLRLEDGWLGGSILRHAGSGRLLPARFMLPALKEVILKLSQTRTCLCPKCVREKLIMRTVATEQSIQCSAVKKSIHNLVNCFPKILANYSLLESIFVSKLHHKKNRLQTLTLDMFIAARVMDIFHSLIPTWMPIFFKKCLTF